MFPDAAAPSPTPSGNHLRVPPPGFQSTNQDWDWNPETDPDSPPMSPTFEDPEGEEDQDVWSKDMDALETLSQASDMVINTDTESLASSFNASSTNGRPMRSFNIDNIPGEHHHSLQHGDNNNNSAGPDYSIDLDEIPLRSRSPTESLSNSTKATAEFHLREVEEQLQNIFTPTPMELYRVTLYKIRDCGGFGFCISDGVYEKGVYVSAIQPGGPADRSGVINPYDRILQVSVPLCKWLLCHLVIKYFIYFIY